MEALGAHETIAEYKLVKCLGEGCLGRVFLAEHLFMKTPVALKLLPEGLTRREGFLDRFQEDIAIISRLDHPSIAKVYQVSQTNGQYYIVSEPVLYQGQQPLNLFEYIRLRGGSLPEDEIFNLLMQLSSALDYAHGYFNEEGIPLAHLSLRPSNILVSERNGQIRFVLTDFGLHRVLGSGHVLKKVLEGVSQDFDLSEKVKKESDVDFRSVYQCMSPEQRHPLTVLQDPKTANAASSDVYSFGAIAYFLLCGEFPEGVFELPSVRRSDLRYNWDRMIMTCLSMKPAKRPKNLVNLLEAVSISCMIDEEEEEIASAPLVIQKPLRPTVFDSRFDPRMGASSTQNPYPSKSVHQSSSSKESAPSYQNQSSQAHAPYQTQALQPPKSSYQGPSSGSSADQSARLYFQESGPRASAQLLDDYEAPIRPAAAMAHISQDCRPAPSRFPPQQGNGSSSAVFAGSNAAQRSIMPGNTFSSGSNAPSQIKNVFSPPSVSFPDEESEFVGSSDRIVLSSENLELEKNVPVTSPGVAKVSRTGDFSQETEMGPTPMIAIQGGRYLRGSNDGSRDEMPRHAVIIGDFAIDVHPVTNEQFVRFLKTMHGEKDEQNNDVIRLKESRIKRVGGKLLIEPGYNRHPVVGVTWYGTLAYCKWTGKRLPTEAEWEVAARGGFEEATYPSGEEIEKSQANFFNSDTTVVMSYPPNPYGLFDMAGNVYEWCQDWYAYNTYELTASEPMYPQGPPQGVYRVLRGGCWKSLKEDLRCAHRHRNNPGAVNRTYGFRCASDLNSEV